MQTILPLFVLAILVSCLLIASWPLLLHRRLRPAFAGLTGTGCIAGGASLIALLVSGVLPIPCFTNAASAQEDTKPAEATTELAAAEPSSTEGSGAASPTPDSRPPAPNSPSPQPPVPSPQPPVPSPQSPDPILEVPPTTEVIIPPGRPSWVDQDPQTDSAGVHTIPVSSGPYKRHIDALRALDEQLARETNLYITDYLGSGLAPTLLRFDISTIRRDLVKPANIYEEKIVSPTTGDMHQIHALIELDQNFRNRLDGEWRVVRANSRLTQLGLFAGAGLLFIGSVFSYFRLDNATRGYYTGRLQFMTAAAILAVIGGGVLAARWIHWL
jgi:hypothetical protein